MFFPTTCPVCGVPGAPVPCPDCSAGFRSAPGLVAPSGVDGCRALFAYSGPAREVVAGLKFQGRRGAVPWLAGLLSEELIAVGAEVVTWAPTSARRRRRRGYDQSELLARRAARCVALPSVRCLARVEGPPQTGRPLVERRLGPRFDARRGIVQMVAGRRVAIIDDVITSGATVSRAAEVISAAGAASVVAVAVARTPPAGASW